MTDRPLPKWLYIYRTPDGWRHSIMGEGLACGYLEDLAIDVPIEQARAAAEAMIADLADYYGAALRVEWDASMCTDDKSSGDLVRAG